MRGQRRGLAVLLLGGFLWQTHADPAIQVGASVPDITRRFGPPTRMIETDEGVLLFYGPTLLYVTRGIVDFVSVGTDPARRPQAALTDTSRPGPATSASTPAPAPAPVLAAADRAPAPADLRHRHASDLPYRRLDTQARLEQDRRQQRIVNRIKRVALNQSYASLHADFLRGAPTTAGSSNVLGIRDARGRPGPTFGDSAGGGLHGLGLHIQALVLTP